MKAGIPNDPNTTTAQGSYTCAFCGETLTARKLLLKHMTRCPKHPLALAIYQLAWAVNTLQNVEARLLLTEKKGLRNALRVLGEIQRGVIGKEE